MTPRPLRRSGSSKQGFTLYEMMVVFLVLGISVASLFTAINMVRGGTERLDHGHAADQFLRQATALLQAANAPTPVLTEAALQVGEVELLIPEALICSLQKPVSEAGASGLRSQVFEARWNPDIAKRRAGLVSRIIRFSASTEDAP